PDRDTGMRPPRAVHRVPPAAVLRDLQGLPLCAGLCALRTLLRPGMLPVLAKRQADAPLARPGPSLRIKPLPFSGNSKRGGSADRSVTSFIVLRCAAPHKVRGCKGACKPGSVPPEGGDSHFSSRPVARTDQKRPTRES